jgi:SAM-dependent methyltransferase
VAIAATVTAAGGRCIACQERLPSDPWTVTAIALYRCPSCASLTALPRPVDRSQSALHDRPDYFDHPYFDLRREAAVTTSRCHQTFTRVGRTIDLTRLRGVRHLDVGCDTGTFLEATARLLGTVPVGIDVSRRAIDEARARGITAFCGLLQDLDPAVGSFDLITAIDVIEHVPDPVALLRAMRARLSARGVVYLETPNIASIVYGVGKVIGLMAGERPRRLRERLFPTEHVQYFTVDGLRIVLERSGFASVEHGARVLSASDLAVSPAMRAGLAALQLADRVRGSGILHWVVARAADVDRDPAA